VEYSFSSTLMIVVISQLVGITDVAAIIGIAGANVSMILFGWLQEKYEQPGGRGWLPRGEPPGDITPVLSRLECESRGVVGFWGGRVLS